jgi:hypothetical protein
MSHKNESRDTYEGVMSHMWTSHVTYMNESCHANQRVMSHKNELRDTCEWDTHTYETHTHMKEICHIYERVLLRKSMSPVKHLTKSCHTCEWVKSHIWMSHVTLVIESCHACEWVMSHMWISHVTDVSESYHTYEVDMGWLRWVGCLKIHVSLQNIGVFCRSLLQKIPIFLSILLIVATP